MSILTDNVDMLFMCHIQGYLLCQVNDIRNSAHINMPRGEEY